MCHAYILIEYYSHVDFTDDTDVKDADHSKDLGGVIAILTGGW